jgi:hypothetical protein
MSSLDNIEFEFTTLAGDVIKIRINRPALAAYVLRKITSPGKGGKQRQRLTRMEGAVIATRRRITL